MAPLRVEDTSTLPDRRRAQVHDLVARIEHRDGVAPMSEQAVLQIGSPGAVGLRHVVLLSDEDGLLGYAQVETAEPAGGGSVEATVELAADDDSHLAALVEAVASAAGDDQTHLMIWAHGEAAPTATVLAGLGYRRGRVLLQLRRSLVGHLVDPVWPSGVTVRSFVVGQDEAAWLALNNVAFATHPDQSNWTLDDVRQREAQPWFDPAGLILAERDGELVGSHWTKVHPADPHPSPGAGSGAIGEVYVVAVAPSMQGQHLGGAITQAGLVHLQSLGLDTVMLYVDESNTSAVHVYERLGFTRFDADACFVR